MTGTKETKKVATKATKTTTPKVKETKAMKAQEVKTVVEEVKTVANAEKVELLDIVAITELYAKFGIVCKNPSAKGNYRIMKGGSSLNIKPTKGYYIYTTDEDMAEVLGTIKPSENLVLEEGTNAQDKSRPNTVICKTTEMLMEVLPIYALNPRNKVVVEAKEEEK